MIEEGLVHAGASPHEWGEFSKQLLDLTGIQDHETIEDNEERCVVKVKDCGSLEPFAYLEAPPDICQLIVEWDNGCLETISPGMRVEIRKCVYRGDPHCLYVYEKRKK